MDYSPVERLVLERFREKTAVAGGPRAGYVLRRQAIRYPHPDLGDAELDAALAGLVERGLLAPNEARDFFFLTEAGVAALAG